MVKLMMKAREARQMMANDVLDKKILEAVDKIILNAINAGKDHCTISVPNVITAADGFVENKSLEEAFFDKPKCIKMRCEMAGYDVVDRMVTEDEHAFDISWSY